MEHLRVADGEVSLQIWRVAVRTLNKQSQITDKGWFSSLRRLDEGLTTPHLKKMAFYEILRRASELEGFFGAT
jgi:hypothetical protein